MRYKRLLEERRSCRSFKEEVIDSIHIAELFTYGHHIKRLDDTIQARFVYIDKGFLKGHILSGRVGYNGFLISAPHYVALVSEEKNNYMQNAGYMMEEFLLKTVELGLASCWLTIIKEEEELKKELDIKATGKLVAIAALGYPKVPLPYTPKDTSYRESISNFIYIGAWDQKPSHEELEARGLVDIFLNLRKAPSWKNHQPWRFIIRQDEILLCVGGAEAVYKHNDIDAGIMMLYMENIFKESGINAEWKRNTSESQYSTCNIPVDYNLIGVLKV